MVRRPLLALCLIAFTAAAAEPKKAALEPASPSPTVAPAALEPPRLAPKEDGVGPVWLWAGLGVLLVGAVAVAAVARGLPTARDTTQPPIDFRGTP